MQWPRPLNEPRDDSLKKTEDPAKVLMDHQVHVCTGKCLIALDQKKRCCDTEQRSVLSAL